MTDRLVHCGEKSGWYPTERMIHRSPTFSLHLNFFFSFHNSVHTFCSIFYLKPYDSITVTFYTHPEQIRGAPVLPIMVANLPQNLPLFNGKKCPSFSQLGLVYTDYIPFWRVRAQPTKKGFSSCDTKVYPVMRLLCQSSREYGIPLHSQFS